MIREAIKRYNPKRLLRLLSDLKLNGNASDFLPRMCAAELALLDSPRVPSQFTLHLNSPEIYSSWETTSHGWNLLPGDIKTELGESIARAIQAASLNIQELYENNNLRLRVTDKDGQLPFTVIEAERFAKRLSSLKKSWCVKAKEEFINFYTLHVDPSETEDLLNICLGGSTPINKDLRIEEAIVNLVRRGDDMLSLYEQLFLRIKSLSTGRKSIILFHSNLVTRRRSVYGLTKEGPVVIHKCQENHMVPCSWFERKENMSASLHMFTHMYQGDLPLPQEVVRQPYSLPWTDKSFLEYLNRGILDSIKDLPKDPVPAGTAIGDYR